MHFLNSKEYFIILFLGQIACTQCMDAAYCYRCRM